MVSRWTRLLCSGVFLASVTPSICGQDGTAVLEQVSRQIDSFEVMLAQANPYEQVDILSVLADLSGSTNTSDIIKYRRLAREISAELGDEECLAYQAYRMIFHLINLGLFEEAREMLNESRAYYVDRDPYIYSEILVRFGFYYGRVINFKSALPSYRNALVLKEQLGDKIGIANVRGRLARIYYLSNNYKRALEYYDSIIADSAEITFPFVANAFHYAGRIYAETGEKELAIRYFTSAKRFRVEPGIRNIGYKHFAQAYIHLLQDEDVLAKAELESSLELFRAVDLKGEASVVLLMQGDLSAKNNDQRQAMDLYRQALGTAQKVFGHKAILMAYQRLSQGYFEEEDYKKAFENLTAYQQLYEEKYRGLEGPLIAQEIEIVQSQYVQQLQLLHAQKEVATLISKRQRTLRNGFIGISLLLLAFLAFIYFQLRQRRRAQLLLEEKNKLIDQALHEKEDLLKEMHHRVKNNLQIVSSMLHLQGRHIQDPLTLAALRDSRNRVNSMALIHQSLYREDHLKGINAKSYIDALTQSLATSYRLDARRMQISSNVEPMLLDVDTAIPLGLITNELVTNAIKYAFNGQESGEIEVELHQQNESLILAVQDNGVGLPPDFEERSGKSYGYQLVRSLARKLKAEVHTENNNGCKVRLSITNFEILEDFSRTNSNTSNESNP